MTGNSSGVVSLEYLLLFAVVGIALAFVLFSPDSPANLWDPVIQWHRRIVETLKAI